MVTYQNVLLFKYLLACYLFTVVASLNLPYLTTTRKPRITKYMTTTSSTQYPGSIENLQIAETTTSTTEKPTSSVFYRVNAKNGATCILLRTDALLSIQYSTTDGEDKEGDAFVPDNAQVTGDCTNEDMAVMTIAWPGFVLNFKFEKTPGGERWYLDKVELTFDTENRIFEHMIDRKHSKYIRLSTSEEHSAMLYPTPVGKSYTCSREKQVILIPANDRAAYFKGILYLRDLRLQPFMYKSDDFGAPFQCSSSGYIRDETAPIAVGSTLAIAVLGTITGYGLFRYFKIKKVQYNTME